MNSQMKRCMGQGLEGSRTQKLLCPWSLVYATLLANRYILIKQTGSSLNLIFLDFLWRFHYIGMTD